ncbi:MAG: hypothetical protein WKF30_01175 [Pyrinomonadaceae bacterium]
MGFDKNARISSLTADHAVIGSFTLEPELLTSDGAMKTGAGAMLAFKDVPQVLVQAITAIEDRRFLHTTALTSPASRAHCCATPASARWRKADPRSRSNW